jgi:hypothetical protein
MLDHQDTEEEKEEEMKKKRKGTEREVRNVPQTSSKRLVVRSRRSARQIACFI